MGLSILIVGGDALARSGLRAILAGTPVSIAGEAPPGPALTRSLLDHDPDVLLWDASGGLAPLAEQEPDVPVVVLVEDEDQAAEALGLGVDGVLLREGDGPRLAAAMEAARMGLVVVDGRLSGAVRPVAERPGGLPEELTGREREVLHHLAEGLSNREIAQELGISEHTAKFHVNAILGKLDARTRTEAVVRAARLGMLIL